MADDQESESDRARRVVIAKIVTGFQKAVDGETVGDAQVALGNFIATMALSHHDPEVTVLTTLEVISEIYRKMRRAKLEGKQAGIVN